MDSIIFCVWFREQKTIDASTYLQKKKEAAAKFALEAKRTVDDEDINIKTVTPKLAEFEGEDYSVRTFVCLYYFYFPSSLCSWTSHLFLSQFGDHSKSLKPKEKQSNVLSMSDFLGADANVRYSYESRGGRGGGRGGRGGERGERGERSERRGGDEAGPSRRGGSAPRDGNRGGGRGSPRGGRGGGRGGRGGQGTIVLFSFSFSFLVCYHDGAHEIFVS